MAHPFHHAQSSARKYGGVPDDYQSIHDWFDCSKSHIALPSHRVLIPRALVIDPFLPILWSRLR